MELTKQERKFAEISAKKYHRLLYRKNQVIGWLGVILFSLGLLRLFSLPAWCHHLLATIGFTMLMWSMLALAMTVTGKLYEHVQRTEAKPEK